MTQVSSPLQLPISYGNKGKGFHIFSAQWSNDLADSMSGTTLPPLLPPLSLDLTGSWRCFYSEITDPVVLFSVFPRIFSLRFCFSFDDTESPSTMIFLPSTPFPPIISTSLSNSFILPCFVFLPFQKTPKIKCSKNDNNKQTNQKTHLPSPCPITKLEEAGEQSHIPGLELHRVTTYGWPQRAFWAAWQHCPVCCLLSHHPPYQLQTLSILLKTWIP